MQSTGSCVLLTFRIKAQLSEVGLVGGSSADSNCQVRCGASAFRGIFSSCGRNRVPRCSCTSQVVPVSGKTGENLDELEEAIVLQQELMGLTAHSRRRAQAYVLESGLDPSKGRYLNVIVKDGTLRVRFQDASGSRVARLFVSLSVDNAPWIFPPFRKVLGS